MQTVRLDLWNMGRNSTHGSLPALRQAFNSAGKTRQEPHWNWSNPGLFLSGVTWHLRYLLLSSFNAVKHNCGFGAGCSKRQNTAVAMKMEKQKSKKIKINKQKNLQQQTGRMSWRCTGINVLNTLCIVKFFWNTPGAHPNRYNIIIHSEVNLQLRTHAATLHFQCTLGMISFNIYIFIYFFLT